MAEKIITIESVDDDESYGKEYKKVMDTNGLYYNVKQGREGSLKAKWNLLKIGAQIKLIFGEYKGKKFVQDIELIAEASEGTSPTESPNLVSKELNTLIMAAKDAWIASKLTTDDPEIKALRKLMCLRFSFPEPAPKVAKPTADKAPLVGTLTSEQLTTLKVLKEQYKLNLGAMIKGCGWNEIKAIDQLTQEQAEHLITKIKEAVGDRSDEARSEDLK